MFLGLIVAVYFVLNLLFAGLCVACGPNAIAKRSDVRELRVQHLLIGADKTGQDRWYDEQVQRAERFYADYLRELKHEGLIP